MVKLDGFGLLLAAEVTAAVVLLFVSNPRWYMQEGVLGGGMRATLSTVRTLTGSVWPVSHLSPELLWLLKREMILSFDRGQAQLQGRM